MSECNHDCASCGVEGCESRNEIQKYKPHELSSFKKTIAIVSGKGGVGKSLVTDLLAVQLTRAGKKVALLDADVTGPSMPRAFGLQHEKAQGDEEKLFAIKTITGIATMSTGYLLEHEADPVIWRGPMIAQLLGSMYRETVYGDCDFLLIDMPPGTGDVPLTVFQSMNVDAILIVTSPQDLVSVIVEKAVNMAKMMDVKIMGLIENMSYFHCPDCGADHYVYGRDKGKEVADHYGIPFLDALPIDPELSRLVDEGKIEECKENYLVNAVKAAQEL